MLRTSFTKVIVKHQHQFSFVKNLQRTMSSLLQSKAYINGKWVDAADGGVFEVKNPANGKVIGNVPNMTVGDCQAAIDAAKHAFHSNDWSSLTAKQRSTLLKTWFRLIEQNGQEIAEIMTAESGKPINESKGEVLYGNSFLEWFAEEARRIYGEIVPAPVTNRELLVMKQPLGVAALITPWNFPLAMITRKAGAALAAGCTVVIKPAEDTPLTCLAVVKLAEDAGIPKGVINVITTKKAAPIGELLCKSHDVGTISFTGSTEVGKLLYRQCADTVKRVSLELGGNAPFIVFDSANLEKAVDGAMASKFRNCGQTCVSANRFFVQEGIYDRFISALKQRIEALKIGSGEFDDTQIGPLVNEMQFNKITEYVEDARTNNAHVLTGGKRLSDLGELFYAPTVITDVGPSARIYTEEVFGPIVSVIKFKTEEEALEKANQTRRGLAGYFFSENLQQVFRVAKRLEVGMVGVNEGLISAAEAPFGGVKESGIGREGCHYGIDEYVDVKYVFGSEFNATQTTDGAAAEKKSEGIAPVLIKQLLKSAEGNFQMFGMTFSMVCIRAIVRNIETSSTKITYLLEDNTGQITAHYWLEEGDTLKAPDVMLNKYATVYGSVRSQGGQKTIMVFKMLPINDPNEIVTHVLEVLYARYKAEQYASSFSGHNFVGASKVSTGFDMPSSSESGLDGKKLAVLQAIKTHQSPDGINRNELKRKFQQMKESELNSILDFMITEGFIYSSIDADHFLSTE